MKRTLMKRNSIVFSALVSISLLALAITTGKTQAQEGFLKPRKAQIELVENLDLQRYAGRWYEQALIPNGFQKQCVGSTEANYTLLPNNQIRVYNQCATKNNGVKGATATARVVDETKSKAALQVAFAQWFGYPLWFLSGSYNVIGIDEDLYQWAVVAGSPDKTKYAWVLSRNTSLSSQQWKQVTALLQQKDYSLSSFVTTPQPGGFTSKQPLSEAL
jgi:apolipoprotein D and lipocalin family protein